MKANIWHRLDLWARHMSPFGLTFVLLLINVIPMRVPRFSQVVPMLALIAVYHWAVYRPQLLPPAAVFLIGVLQDILMGTPIGVGPLALLSVYGSVLYQQRFFAGKSFVIVWLAFAAMAAGALILSWVAMSIFNARLIDHRALFFQYGLTVGFYPLVAWLFMRWQQTFLRRD